MGLRSFTSIFHRWPLHKATQPPYLSHKSCFIVQSSWRTFIECLLCAKLLDQCFVFVTFNPYTPVGSVCYYPHFLSFFQLKNFLKLIFIGASQVALGKESTCSTGDAGSIPGLGRSPEEGNDYPLKNSWLRSPMDREAWQAIVHKVAKSWT